MDGRDYEKILDAIPGAAVFVIREDNHTVLYYNSQVKKAVPGVRRGAVCYDLQMGSCAVCPLLDIGDGTRGQSVSCDSPFGQTVDIVATRTMWEDTIPAFVITVTPHMEDVSHTYHEILRVNLTQDRVRVMRRRDMEGDSAKEGTDIFSRWLEEFTGNGGIHPDDIERFLNFAKLEHLREALRAGRKTLTCSFRRPSGEGFRWNMLEVVADSGYTDQSQIAIFYIKDVHDTLRESLEMDETSIRLQEVTRTLGEHNLCIYSIDLNDGTVNLIREDGRSEEGRAVQTLMWEAVMRSHLLGHIHEDYKDKFRQCFSLENLRRVRDTGVRKTDMLCLWNNGGDYRYAAVIAYFDTGQGMGRCAVLALQDVDKRVRKEQASLQRDMQMAAILKSRFHVMTTVHLEENQCERLWFNDQAEPQQTQTGCYTHYFQQALDSTVCSEDIERFKNTLSPEHMRKRAEETRDYSEEICQYRMKGAAVRWLEQHVVYIRRDNRTLVTILGRDITKEKLQEETQRKMVQEQADIINSLGSMFFATYYVNLERAVFRSVTQLEEVGSLLGDETDYPAAQRLYAEHFVHPEDRADYLYTMSIRNLRQVLSPEQPFVTFAYRKLPENRNVGAEGYEWIRATAVTAQTDSDGKPKGVVYAAQDVTDSKRKEMREQRALQAACEAANHANVSKSEFLSRMSHDIRTPINGIVGMTQIAANHLEDSAKVQDCLEKINTSSAHLLTLVNEILEMSDIEAGNVELLSEAFSLSDLIRDVEDTVRPSVMEKGVNLEIRPLRLQCDKVIGDRGRLKQVFLNVLGNSIKYTPEGGLLEMSCTSGEVKQSGCCSYDFAFRDNGIGMEEEFVPHIFEPFARAEDSRISKIEGVGLGMTIAQNFVRMMGGSINVKSRRGTGTQVTVTLFLKMQNPQEASGEADQAEDASPDIPFRGCRVLVVDDNLINQEVAMEIISSMGASVECASNGKEGLERFEEMQEGYYDMIFMDIQMPVMNGYEAVRAIRKLPRGDALSVPILALSANAFAEDIAASREAGMNDHICKPFDIPRLMACMERWMGGRKAPG